VTVDRDDDLRVRFAALRAGDAKRAPTFAAPEPAHPRGRALAWSGGALAVAAVLALSFAWRGGEQAAVVATGVPDVMLHVAVDMPSDFLLDDELSDVRRDAPQFAPEPNDEVPFL
jgi:hypothetical protein